MASSFHTRVWFTALHVDNVNVDYYTSDYSANWRKRNDARQMKLKNNKLLISTKLSAESANNFNAYQSVFMGFSFNNYGMNYTTVSAQPQSLTF